MFVARTADEGMSRSLSDAIAMMLETGAISLEELLDTRMLLEVPLAGLAAFQADEDTVQRLREAIARPAARPAHEALAATDAEIHRTIAAASGNRMMQALTDWIFEVVQPPLIEVLEPAIVTRRSRAARWPCWRPSRRATPRAPSAR